MQDYCKEKYMNKQNCIILYHASKNGIEGVIKPISNKGCDFGKGFYMSASEESVKSLLYETNNPKVYTLELNLTGLKILNLDLNIDWLMFIAYNWRELDTFKETQV